MSESSFAKFLKTWSSHRALIANWRTRFNLMPHEHPLP